MNASKAFSRPCPLATAIGPHSGILRAFRTSNYRGAMEEFPLAAPCTLKWFYQLEGFVKLSSRPNGGWLWNTADPGFGKSVLCRQIVEQHQNVPSLLVTYVFLWRLIHCTARWSVLCRPCFISSWSSDQTF